MDEGRQAAVSFVVFIVATIALIIVGFFTFYGGGRQNGQPSGNALRLDDIQTARSQSSWRNANGDVAYVGNDTCVSCHESQHESYLATAHSRAMQLVAAETEPPNARFDHPASQRQYEVRRRENQLFHREAALDVRGELIAELEHPLKWLVGSGRHSRSYLVEIDGFLTESPVTWYETRQAWSMSPGYDASQHASFERAIDDGCLYCHVGRTESADDQSAKVRIVEAAISCERCHGPGELHVAKHEKSGASAATASGEIDDTIVNPAHLSRRYREDICGQCHLRGDATVALYPLSLSDFRPGRALSEVRIDYRRRSPTGEMTVVGHVEQMRLSKCYTKSSMTCTTCHEPHLPSPDQQHYQRACLSCHTSDECREPLNVRRSANDNACVKCHMPTSQTDIPHIAFTHHRIGVHKESEAEASRDRDDLQPLIPWSSVDHLTKWEQERARGLAYFEYAEKLANRDLATRYRKIARETLESLLGTGEPDAEIDAVLARLIRDEDPQAAKHAALHALNDPSSRPATRANMLYLLSELSLEQKEFDVAAGTLEDLIGMRRHSEDFFLLGIARLEQQRFADAVEPLQKAVELNPFRPEIHEALAAAYDENEQPEMATRQRETAEALRAAQRSIPIP